MGFERHYLTETSQKLFSSLLQTFTTGEKFNLTIRTLVSRLIIWHLEIWRDSPSKNKSQLKNYNISYKFK